MSELAIELGSLRELPACPCCGKKALHAVGSVLFSDDKRAEYLIAWHPGEAEEDALWLFRFADEWDHEGPLGESEAVLLRCGIVDGKFGFGIVDADCDFARSIASGAKLLPRSAVAGTEFAREIFESVDYIWLNDDRIKEITERG